MTYEILNDSEYLRILATRFRHAPPDDMPTDETTEHATRLDAIAQGLEEIYMSLADVNARLVAIEEESAAMRSMHSKLVILSKIFPNGEPK